MDINPEDEERPAANPEDQPLEQGCCYDTACGAGPEACQGAAPRTPNRQRRASGMKRTLSTPSVPTDAKTFRPAFVASRPAGAGIINLELEKEAELAEQLLQMFPTTDRNYIQFRAVDLVGRPAAMERFIVELLEDPTPPQDWRQMLDVLETGTAAATLVRPPAATAASVRPPAVTAAPVSAPTATAASVWPPAALVSPLAATALPIWPPAALVSPPAVTAAPVRTPAATAASVRPPAATATSVRPPAATAVSVRPPAATAVSIRPPAATAASVRPPAATATPVRHPSATATSVSAAAATVRPPASTAARSMSPSGSARAPLPVLLRETVGRDVPEPTALPAPVVQVTDHRLQQNNFFGWLEAMRGAKPPPVAVLDQPKAPARPVTEAGRLQPQPQLIPGPDAAAFPATLPNNHAAQPTQLVGPDTQAEQLDRPLQDLNELGIGQVEQEEKDNGQEEEAADVAWETEKLVELSSLFPDYSPDWLRNILREIRRLETPFNVELANNILQQRVFDIFSLDAEERKKIPTLQKYKKEQLEREEMLKWTGNMTPLDMIQLYNGDPSSYFYDQSRTVPSSGDYAKHALRDLKATFRFHSISDINSAFWSKSRNLYAPAFRILQKLPNSRKTRRPDGECAPPFNHCLAFLKEKKFVELEPEIKKVMESMAAHRQQMVQDARAAGLLLECEVCCNDDCLESDMVACAGGHRFCKECVKKGAEEELGVGHGIIQCLTCCEEMMVQELQKALPPNMLSRLLQKRQIEEISSAGLEGLVACPFCPYQTIMENPHDKVLVCMNPECGRQSCRLCKEPSHIPLRCEELERTESMRKKIEEDLSMALIRKCHKCEQPFLKEEGCNMMTCPRCKTRMCYLCKNPVQDYSHFYGQGGSPSATRQCPLWSNMTHLHSQELAIAAKKAKEELAAKNVSLKWDPTRGIPEPAAGPPPSPEPQAMRPPPGH